MHPQSHASLHLQAAVPLTCCPHPDTNDVTLQPQAAGGGLNAVLVQTYKLISRHLATTVLGRVGS